MFTPVEPKEKVHNMILKQIMKLIIDGELKAGDKLPPERQLSETLGVGRPTLKQTLSILETMGIVECRQGDGNYILPFQNKLFNPIVMAFYTSNGNMENVLEVRYILEVQNIKIVAQKRTEEDLKILYDLLEQMKGEKTLEERVLLNCTFHAQLIKIGGNPLVISFYQSILELIGEHITTTDGKNFYETHKEIADYIRLKDSEAASNVMITHFTRKFPNYKYYAQI